nr:MAG: hypothetical protein DIU78_06915 [Pseudomonadota bacterium]
MREEEGVRPLRRALADGTIDAIATDHAPHSPLEKDCELSQASPGIMGLELCFGLLLGLVGQDGLTLPRLLEALSQRPARIAGLEPPRLVEGAVAELVLLDPEWRWTPRHTRLETKSKNSPFMDRELKGRVAMTLAAGRIVYEAVEGVP